MAGLDDASEELARLRLRGPRPVSTARAAVVCALVVAYGNGVVVAGRVWGLDEWITLAAVPALGLAGAALLVRRGWRLADVGVAVPVLPAARLPRVLLIGSVGVVAAVAVVGLATGTARPLSVLRVVIGTAVGEELVHRGVVLTVWNGAGVRPWVVVVANMVAFGLWHVAGATHSTGFSPHEVLVPFAGAAVLVWARLGFRSVLAPAVFHALANIWGV